MSRILILAVGTDVALLHTRSDVLPKAGYVVVETSSPRRAVAEFYAGDYDFVILCHSLSPEDTDRLERAMHSRSPGAPIIYVQPLDEQARLSSLIFIEAEPQKLFGLLRRLTEERSSVRKECA